MKLLNSTLIALIWKGEAFGRPVGLIVDRDNRTDQEFADYILTCAPDSKLSVITGRKILLYNNTKPTEPDIPSYTILIAECSGIPDDLRQTVVDGLISIGYGLPEEPSNHTDR